MGAYGAALYAARSGLERSGMLKAEELSDFQHEAKPSVCSGARTGAVSLSTFSQAEAAGRFISGNRCSKPLGREKAYMPNMFKYKLERLREMQEKGAVTAQEAGWDSLRPEHV